MAMRRLVVGRTGTTASIVSSEIARGLDVFELMPSAFISQNEIDAAKTVHFDYLNAQGQPKFVWPPSFALARAYVDQLERSKGLGEADLASARKTLDRAEKGSATERHMALSGLAALLTAGPVRAPMPARSSSSRV